MRMRVLGIRRYPSASSRALRPGNLERFNLFAGWRFLRQRVPLARMLTLRFDMSWDVWIFRAPPGLVSIEDMPPNYTFPPLDRQAVYTAARHVFGHVEALGWVDTDDGKGTLAPVILEHAAFLRVDGPNVYGEIGLTLEGDNGNERGQLTMNIRSGSEAMVTSILEFAATLRARAFDLQSGDWLTPDAGAGSFARWIGYCDRVVGQPDAE